MHVTMGNKIYNNERPVNCEGGKVEKKEGKVEEGKEEEEPAQSIPKKGESSTHL